METTLITRQQRRQEERRLRKLAIKEAKACQVAIADAARTLEISQAKLEANRRNAQLSTGARTPEGRAICARNNFRHGFTGAFCLLPSESPDDYEQFLQGLLTQYQPANTAEETLVANMAQHQWLTQRALRLQDTCFTEEGVDDKKLNLYMRYLSQHERGFHKCLNDLLRLRKEQEKEQRGFESQTAAKQKQEWAGEMHSFRVGTEILKQSAIRMQMRQPIIGHTPAETADYFAELQKELAANR